MRSDAQLEFHELTFHRRIHDWVVGHEPTGDYLTVDDEGKAIIEHLANNPLDKTRDAHPDRDVENVAQQLVEAGLVHKIDHRVVSEHKHLTDILDLEPHHLAWLHSNATWGVVLGVILAGIALLLTQPGLTPRWHWLFATDHLALLIPLAALTYWGVLFVHELGHYLLLKRTGHTTGLAIIHKWHFLLPHANISNARLLTPRKQALVHLGGLLADLFVLGIAATALSLGWAAPFFKLVILLAFLNILFQFVPVRGTDVTRAAQQYYGIQDVPRLLAKTGLALCPFCKKDTTLSQTQEHAAKQLLPLWIVGLIILAVLLLGYVIPAAWIIITGAIAELLVGAARGDNPLFVDGLVTLFLLAATTSFYAVSLIREHPRNAKHWFTWLSVALFITANYLAVFLIAAAFLVYASPPATTTALFVLGLVFGTLFVRLLGHIKVEETGFARDFFLPVFAAATALLLMAMTGWLSATTGAVHAQAIHAVAYGAGMLGALIV